MLLMMVANRINLANLAIQQSRNLLKMLQTLQRKAATNRDRLIKEMLSLADTLASTIAAKRYFVDQPTTGNFEIDPRFLLFEYCHGMLLRQAQVHLVKKLIKEITEGHSVCHQVCVCMIVCYMCAFFD